MNPRSIKILAVIGTALLSACSTGPEPLQVSLQASDFRFEPATIEVMAGQQVTVMMQNMGTVEHDFVIQEIPVEALAVESEAEGEGHTMPGMGTEMEPAVHMGATAGMSDSVTFVPTKPGTYEFYCAVAGHREAGMVGSLMVRER
jgi:uncharacterized cupredoxin-like copper-binding protein